MDEEDDDTQVYGDALTVAYQSGYYDGKKAAQPAQERNFCSRCGKRTADLTVIHTCTRRLITPIYIAVKVPEDCPKPNKA